MPSEVPSPGLTHRLLVGTESGGMGAQSLGELRSLGREKNPQILETGLLGMAQRLMDRAESKPAGEILSLLSSKALDPGIRSQARARGAEFAGSEGFGRRVERLIRDFGSTALDPVSLAALTAAPLVFRATRFWAFSRLASSPLSRGFLPSVAAYSFGFACEVGAFTALTRGARALAQAPRTGLEEELAGNALFLAGVKVGGLGQAELSRRLPKQRLLAEAATLGGIYLGHASLQAFGIGPPRTSDAILAESLAGYLHVKIGARLTQGLIGPRYFENSSKSGRRDSSWLHPKGQAFPGLLSLAGRPGMRPAPAKGPQIETSLHWGERHSTQIVPLLSKGSGDPSAPMAPAEERVVRTFLHDLPPSSLSSIKVIQDELLGDNTFVRLLAQTKPQNMDSTLRRLRHIVTHADRFRARGGYAGWLTRVALEEVLQERSAPKLESLLNALWRGGPLRTYEETIAAFLPPARLPSWAGWVPALLRGPEQSRIQGLPLDAEAREALGRWSFFQNWARPNQGFTLPVEELLNGIEGLLWNPDQIPRLNRALWLAAVSPLALARFYRLHQVLQARGGLLDSKLEEMGDEDFQLSGPNPFPKVQALGEGRNQFNAYLGTDDIHSVLQEYYRRAPALMSDVAGLERRLQRRQELLARIPDIVPWPRKPAILSGALRMLGDPLSLQVLQGMAQGLHLEILPEEGFEARLAELPGAELGTIPHQAVYFHAGIAGDKALMLFRDPPLKHLKEQGPEESLFELLANLLHEYRHHMDIRPGEKRSEALHLRQELLAHAVEYLWRAEHGDVRWMKEFEDYSHAGFALHFRDKFEEWYGDWFQGNAGRPGKASSDGGGSRSPKVEDLERIKGFLQDLPRDLKAAMEGVQDSSAGSLDFIRTLLHSRIEAPEIRELSLYRIAHALRHSRPDSDQGSYLNWLIRTCFEDLQARQRYDRLDPLLELLVQGGPILEFERFLANDLPLLSLEPWPGWIPRLLHRRDPHYDQIASLHLSPEAKQILLRWTSTLSSSSRASAHFAPTTELLGLLHSVQEARPMYFLPIEGILKNAGQSPLGLLRMKRLQLLLREPTELTFGKLAELADPDLFMTGRGPLLAQPPRGHPSQFNAYIHQRAPEGLLREIQQRATELLGPIEAALRRKRREEVLSRFLAQRGLDLNYSLKDLIDAFSSLGDPLSQRVVQSIQEGPMEIRVLKPDEFLQTLRQWDPEGKLAGSQNAIYLHGSYNQGRAVMLVRRFPMDLYSPQTSPDAFFMVLAKIVHEHQHHLDIRPGEVRTPFVHFYQEMSAHLREALWRAGHGDILKLKTLIEEGSGGLALNFRDSFEKDYGDWFQPKDR